MSELKGFKVSDQMKQQVKSGDKRPKGAGSDEAPAASTGFPRVEAIVESGDLGGLTERKNILAEMAKSGANKDKLAAKKAAAAYARAEALLSYLLETKARLAGG